MPRIVVGYKSIEPQDVPHYELSSSEGAQIPELLEKVVPEFPASLVVKENLSVEITASVGCE